MYDLLIKGGTVIDPAQNLNGVCDVAIQDGKIARVAPDIPAAEAAEVLAVPGKPDTTHGRMNFSFKVGPRVLAQGLLPHCISADLTLPGRQSAVPSMTER